MNPEIKRTKLHRPPVPDLHVHRDRLLALLDEARKHPLVLVTAPAGYGKSTIVSFWLESHDVPHAWVSLEREDSDLHTFLQYFLSAIETVIPAAFPNTFELLESAILPPPDVLTKTLANEMERIEQECILVLDDFHLVREKAVHDLLSSLLRHPPRNIRFVTIGRTDPFLPISDLRARGVVTEIRTRDLLFSEEETSEFLQVILKKPIDKHIAAEWTKRTEGWVTGLRLAALSLLHKGDLKSPSPEIQPGSHYLMEYLFDEVFSLQPPEIRDYLLAASLVDRFCAPLCDALVRRDAEPEKREIDGWKFITHLKTGHLFIIHLDTEDRWFRFHNLFQNLLQKHLKQNSSPEEIAALHSRAGAWFEENNLINEAIQHFLAAGDPCGAAEIIEKHRLAAFNADQWHMVRKWVSLLPDEIKLQRPLILLCMAWIAYFQFRIGEIPALLERIDQIIDPDTGDGSVSGERHFFKSYLSILEGKGLSCLKHIRQAMKLLPENFELAQGDSLIYWGLGHQMIGEKGKAIRELTKSMEKNISDSRFIRARRMATVGFVHLIAGALIQAEQASAQMKQLVKGSGLKYTDLWGSYLLGNCSFNYYDLDEARQHFQYAVDNKYIFHTRGAISALVGLALTYQAMHRMDDSRETMEELLVFARDTNDPSNLLIAHSCQARLSVLAGDIPSAALWLKTLTGTPEMPNMLFFLENPSITQCRVLVAIGSDENLREAAAMLEGLWKANEAIHNIYQMIEIGVLRALALQKMSRTEEALAILEHVVTLSSPGGWIRPFVEPGPPMAELLNRLSKKNVELDYIRRILAAIGRKERVPTQGVADEQTVRLPPSSPQFSEEPLSRRETEVLSFLCKGMSNKEIASNMYISDETVRKHLYNIYQKLHVSKRGHAVRKAMEMGIISPPRSTTPSTRTDR